MKNNFLQSLLDGTTKKLEAVPPVKDDSTPKPEPEIKIEQDQPEIHIEKPVPKMKFPKTYCRDCDHSKPYHPIGADGRKFPVSSGWITCEVGKKEMSKIEPVRCRFSTEHWINDPDGGF